MSAAYLVPSLSGTESISQHDIELKRTESNPHVAQTGKRSNLHVVEPTSPL